jgi:hypothetical protein
LAVAVAFVSAVAVASVVALVPEIGPGFSPDIQTHQSSGLQPPGQALAPTATKPPYCTTNVKVDVRVKLAPPEAPVAVIVTL